ncbi:MAG TPA: ABC transporter permease [Candidatus Limnocylindrales bacterium]
MSVIRLLGISWWLQLKMRSRSAFDGLLSILWPLFFATSVFLMFRQASASGAALLSAAVGASVMGIWSAVSTTASSVLQMERRLGTLELLVAAPRPFALLLVPVTLSMATIGAYSMIVTLLWGRFVFGIEIAVRSPALFVLSTLVTVLAVAIFGFLLAVASVRYRVAWALGSALEAPVWLICGFLVAVDDLPGWVRPISWLLAPTWGMSAIRASAQGRNPLGDIAICLSLAAVYMVVGIVLSRLMINSARAHATLALT